MLGSPYLRLKTASLRIATSLVVLALLLLPLLPSQAQPVEPRVTLSQSVVVSGDVISVVGSGFPAETTGQIFWSDGTPLGSFATDEAGAFAIDVVAPAALPGSHDITAVTSDGAASAQMALTIEPIAEPTSIPTEPPPTTEAPLPTTPLEPTNLPLPTAPLEPTEPPVPTVIETQPVPTATGMPPVRPYTIVNSSNSENDQPVVSMYDSDLTTWWTTSETYPTEAWVRFDLGALQPISHIRWYVAVPKGLSEVEIRLSDDGITWVTLTTVDETGVGVGTWDQQGVNVVARYIELSFTNPDGHQVLGGFAEIEAWPADSARPLSAIVTPVPQETINPNLPTEPAPPVLESGSDVGTIVTTDGSGVNCRVAPDISSSIITVLPSGITIQLAGNTIGDWQPVYCDSQPGYVSTQFVDVDAANPSPTDDQARSSSPVLATASTPAAAATPTGPVALVATPVGDASEPPVIGDSMSLPLRATFYYPWFPEAWNQRGTYPYTTYTPSRGIYDGNDPSVVSGHIDDMQYGGIDVGIASWWGQGSREDARIPLLLDAASGTGFKWTLYLEDEGRSNPSIASIRSDLEYIRDQYASHPSFLRIDGRFVVFVYGSAESCGMVDRWVEANQGIDAFLVLKVFSDYRNCTHQPDSWHQYGPAMAADAQGSHSYTISPGFVLTGADERLPRDVDRWQRNVQNMVASGADWQLISTFNEWGEGTAIESAVEWESPSGYGLYLDVLHSNGNTLPSATVTAAVTATATTGAGLSFTPVADAEVREEEPDTSYGTLPTLSTDREPPSHSYFLFNITGIDVPIERVVLRLWVDDGTSNGPPVYAVDDTGWSETGITWSNRPDPSIAVDDHEAIRTGTWLEYDVTQLVSGNGLVSFALVPESRDGLDVNSREATENNPHLVINPVNVTPTPTQNATPVLPTPAGDAAILLAAGDISTCANDGDEQTARILDRESGVIATLGDNAYDSGTARQFSECYDPTWGRHKDRTFPSPGNHEYRSSEAAPYFDYFGAAAGPGYYSYDVGSWHVISLNSNIPMNVGSDQERWLRNDLEVNTATCTLAYWHHPLYSSSATHGNTPATRPLFQALYDHGAEIVLGGHDHTYERFAPQTPDGQADPKWGIRQFVVGTGGRNHYAMGAPEPNSEVRNTGSLGIIKLALYDNGYTWEFLPVAGASFTDRGSGSCHDAPGETQASSELSRPQRLRAPSEAAIPGGTSTTRIFIRWRK